MEKKANSEEIRVQTMQVDENIILYGNSFICTDNISLMTISPIPKNTQWIWAILLAIAGIVICQESAIGILAILFGIAWCAFVIWRNQNRGENLAISLNSGVTLYFHCQDRFFLNQVIDVMINCIKGGSKSKYTIRFDKCEINGNVLSDSHFN